MTLTQRPTRTARTSTRRRVLHVLPDLAIGGGQTIVLNHLRHADRDRFDVDVLYLGTDDAMSDAYADAGSPPARLASGEARRGVRELLDVVKKRSVDALHVHSPMDRRIGQPVGLLAGVPVVSHLHGEGVHLGPHLPNDPGPIARARASITAQLRDRIEQRSVTHYIAESQRVHDVFRSLVRQPITVLRQSIPLDRFDAVPASSRAALRAELGIDEHATVLVNVARLVDDKGQEWLLDMMALLVPQRADLCLVLVGDGPNRLALERQVRELGLERHVRFAGTRSDVPAMLVMGDVFVFGSSTEGFGLAPLEAMAARLPVVAFRLPALEEFVTAGVTGLFADVGDVPALAAHVLRLVANPAERARMGQEARETVDRRYPMDGTARTFEEVYQAVMSKERMR